MSRWPNRTVEERFLAKVDKTTGDACWLWRGYTCGGYGRFTINATRPSQKAHRVSYELFIGQLAGDTVLHHTCENPRCVNPQHLEPMRQQDHALLGTSPPARNARKTHCPKGHEYTPENTVYYGPRQWRSCRTCAHQVSVTRAAQRKAERHARKVAA